MRVARGRAEQRVETLNEEIRARMLEQVRVLVDLVPRVAQRRDEEGLQQPVAAHHPHGEAAAFLRELHARVALVIDEPLGRQTLDRLRGRGQLLPRAPRQFAQRHRVPAGMLRNIPQDLEIILSALGQVRQPKVFIHEQQSSDPAFRACTRAWHNMFHDHTRSEISRDRS